MKRSKLRGMISLLSAFFLVSGTPVMGVNAAEQTMATQELTSEELSQSAEDLTETAEEFSSTATEDQVNVAEGLNNYDSFVSARNYAADPGAKVINLSLGGTHNTVKDDAIQYKITFNAEGAINVPGDIMAVEGENVTIPTTIPVKWGSTFRYWGYVFRQGGILRFYTYRPGEQITASMNMTLTAVWSSPIEIDNTFPKNYYAEISDAGTHLWYKFTPEETGRYEFTSYQALAVDAMADLYREDQTRIISDDDSGGGRAFKIIETLEAGKTYYLETYLNKPTATDTFPVTVDRLPYITQQPQSVTVVEGEQANFQVTANGNGLNYQWCFSSDWKNWIVISTDSAKTNKFTFTATMNTAGGYKCIITDAQNRVIVTQKVTLNITPAGPVITTQPASQTVKDGEKANFTVKATGTGLTYQWKVSANNGTSWSAPSAVAAKTANYSFVTKAAQNGYLFKCVITDADGKTVETNAVKLTVKSNGPVITTQPTDQTVSEGAKATFKVVASGEGLTYQWKVSSNNGTSWSAPSAAAAKKATYSITTKATHNGYLFKCVITDANKKEVETNAVKLTVKSNGPVITTQPADQTVDVGAKATFKVAATGDGLTYQWKVSSDNGTSWSSPSAAAAKTATYSITTKASQNGYLFKCVITDANGKVVETNAVKLTVKLDGPVITTQPTDQSVTAGAKATFKVAAVGDGLTYQWKVSANNGSTWSAPSATAAKTATYSFTTKAAHNGYLVKCVITDANGKVVESNVVKLTVN